MHADKYRMGQVPERIDCNRGNPTAESQGTGILCLRLAVVPRASAVHVALLCAVTGAMPELPAGQLSKSLSRVQIHQAL